MGRIKLDNIRIENCVIWIVAAGRSLYSYFYFCMFEHFCNEIIFKISVGLGD